MNEQQLAAVKMALEALKWNMDYLPSQGHGTSMASQAITALQSIIDQDTLYKMAEDAVTIGLSYNDWPKIGCVNHDCDKCKAVQEPVAVVSGYYGGQCVILPTDPARLFNSGTAFYTAPPAAPVQEPDGYVYGNSYWETTNLRITDDVKRFGSPRYATPPAQQKPWVDLSDEEIDALAELYGLDYMSYAPFVRAIEQRLKEKNT